MHSDNAYKTYFLRLTLSGDSVLGISVTPYRKLLSTNSTLMADSCHLPHVVKNVPVGEFINLKWNCSNSSVYPEVEAETLARLRAYRYPEWALNRARHIVSEIPREKLMSSKNSRNKHKCDYIKSGTIVFFHSF